MYKQTLTGLLTVGFLWGLTSPALAIKQFQTEFYNVYGIDSKAENPSEYAQKVIEAKCYLCHQGKKKKNHNPYGTELKKLLDRKEDKTNVEKIQQALATVAKIHSNPDDDSSPTYGELIKAGKLPGGTLEEAKEEPEGSEEAE